MLVIKSEPYYRGRSGILCYDIKVYGSMYDEKKIESFGKVDYSEWNY